MLDDGGAGGAVHALYTQVLVLKSIFKLGPGRLRQFAHPAYAKSFRVIMQTEPGTVLFLNKSNISFSAIALLLETSNHTELMLMFNAV